MSTIIIFDVDGTLCDTCLVDEECFLRAIGDEFGRELDSPDWSAGPHVTDSGILDWLWWLHRGRAPVAEEVFAVIDRFVRLLKEARGRAPDRFKAIPGAPDAVTALRRSGLRVAAATGGWRPPARFKLECAQISPDILLASSTDSPDRPTVFRLAAERACRTNCANRDVLLVGDGVWDVAVARQLNWRFLGIASGDKADRLSDAGAGVVLPHFANLAALEAAIAVSPVPASMRVGRRAG